LSKSLFLSFSGCKFLLKPSSFSLSFSASSIRLRSLLSFFGSSTLLFKTFVFCLRFAGFFFSFRPLYFGKSGFFFESRFFKLRLAGLLF